MHTARMQSLAHSTYKEMLLGRFLDGVKRPLVPFYRFRLKFRMEMIRGALSGKKSASER
jgi:hypothetical protein